MSTVVAGNVTVFVAGLAVVVASEHENVTV
jgi:hypothetical protein